MGKKNNRNNTKQKVQEPNINGDIRFHGDVRVIQNTDGQRTAEIMPIGQARNLADEQGLDLIEINASATPPVVMIADYGKWLYEQKKKLKEKTQPKCVLKEIQLTANIGTNDMEVKARKVREFVEDGNKVKVVLRLKKREAERMEESKRSLYEFMIMVSDFAVADSMPKDEGNRSVVTLRKK